MLSSLLVSGSVRATINTAASASLANVTSAYALCSDGDILSVPAGTATWTTTLTINKAIQLIGAGIDQTIITDGTGNNLQLIVWGTTSNTFSRLSGFTFQGPGGGDANTGAIAIEGTCHAFRLDHCKFDSLDKYAIFNHSWIYGVIDHCQFLNCTASLEVKMENYGGGDYGDGSWADADNWGTTNALYVEDCSFWNNGGLDGCDGARVVWRYNHITNNAIASHGTESSGRERSFRLLECYQNTFSWPTNSVGTHWADAVYIRGGTAVIFSNLITGGIQRVSFMVAYRGWNSPWPVWGNVNPLNHWDTNSTASDSGHATASGIVLTDSGKSWTPSQFTGAGYFLYNTNSGMAWAITANDATTITTESGYHDIAGGAGVNSYFTSGDGYQIYQVNHILDQPGTGQGDLIAGDTPLNTVTGTAVWPHEAFDPIYIWGNTLDYQYPDSAYGPPVNGGASQSTSVVQGRDWIDGTPKPGYTPLVYPHPLVGTNEVVVTPPSTNRALFMNIRKVP